MRTRLDVVLQSLPDQHLEPGGLRSTCPYPVSGSGAALRWRRLHSVQPATHIAVSQDQTDDADVNLKETQDEVDRPSRDTPSEVGATIDHSIEPEPLAKRPLGVVVPTLRSDQYGDSFDLTPRRTRFAPNSTCSFLKPGAKFEGSQKSDRSKYDVQVEIKHVDMADSFLCGFLRIRGLTDDHPTLTTFFEGEIIGTKHTFKTKHAEWGSTEKEDMAHWGRFPAWRPLSPILTKFPDLTSKSFAQREHVFMRWKEQFLVPDHRVRTINGASFEGFYYICFHQISGSISGIYFHAGSERYQQLELKYVQDYGCMNAFEFR